MANHTPTGLGPFARFRLDRAVAYSGRTGVVLEAEIDPDTPRARRVALTVLDPAQVYGDAHVERWAIATTVEHPALIGPIDFGVERHTPFVAAAWQDGYTLSEITQVLHAEGAVPSTRMLASIGVEVADALRAAAARAGSHDAPHGLVHGRLGPGRVMVTTTGHVRVLGFVGRPADVANEDLEGVRALQAPPRQAGAAPTIETDIYALARLLHQAGGDGDPELAGILTETLDAGGRAPDWFAARLRRFLADHGGEMGPPDWRVVLAELPAVPAAEDPGVRTRAEQILAATSARPRDPRPPRVWAGLLFAVACGLAVSYGIREFRPSVPGSPPAPPTAAATPAEMPPAPVPQIAPSTPPPPAPATLAEGPAPAATPQSPPIEPVPPTPSSDRRVSGVGRLVVRSTPAAVVYVDDEPLGTTPFEKEGLAAGTHAVELRLAGYATERRQIRIGAGDPAEWTVKLRPAALGTGAVTVRSTPASVVYIDGQPIGTTPIEASPLSAARHVVEVRLGGHGTERREIEVRDGQTVSLDITLHPIR